MGIRNGKLDSECPSAYSFMITSAGHFRDTRPCTNIPIKCPLDCNQIHWKYNFETHLRERHPQWRQILPPGFLSTIQISSAEQQALGIPLHRVIEWPPPISPPPPASPLVHGRKRGASCLQNSPSRRSNKENEAIDSDMRASKTIRLG
jgi:hypothetical protein